MHTHTQTLAAADMELGAAEALEEERTALALETLDEQQKGVEALGDLEVHAAAGRKVLFCGLRCFRQNTLCVPQHKDR